jgi:AcrR family transcriptional regulator
VYHYFSDRDQVDIEIMNRHLRDLYGHLSDALHDDDGWTTITDAVDATIIPMIAYFRAHPSAVELWFYGRSEALSSMVESFDEEAAEHLLRLLIDRGQLRDDTPLLAMQVAFEAANSLFDLAFRRTPGSGDDAVLDETRRLASAYLESYAPSRGRRKK